MDHWSEWGGPFTVNTLRMGIGLCCPVLSEK